MIKDSDLGGFNSNRFDIPLLAEELLRAGYDFDLSKHKPLMHKLFFTKWNREILVQPINFIAENL
jgi:DNA polymerase-3 subunit epsilon